MDISDSKSIHGLMVQIENKIPKLVLTDSITIEKDELLRCCKKLRKLIKDDFDRICKKIIGNNSNGSKFVPSPILQQMKLRIIELERRIRRIEWNEVDSDGLQKKDLLNEMQDMRKKYVQALEKEKQKHLKNCNDKKIITITKMYRAEYNVKVKKVNALESEIKKSIKNFIKIDNDQQTTIRLNWEILPKGKLTRNKIREYCKMMSNKNPRKYPVF